jgi:hypothetical protein
MNALLAIAIIIVNQNTLKSQSCRISDNVS